MRLQKKRGEIVRSEKKVTEVAATSRGMEIKMRIRKAVRAKRLTERRIGVTRVLSPSFFLCQVIFLSSPFPPSFAAVENLQPVCRSCPELLMLILLKRYINRGILSLLVCVTEF